MSSGYTSPDARERARVRRLAVRHASGVAPRPLVNPTRWTEGLLTERWEDRKARRAMERGQCA